MSHQSSPCLPLLVRVIAPYQAIAVLHKKASGPSSPLLKRLWSSRPFPTVRVPRLWSTHLTNPALPPQSQPQRMGQRARQGHMHPLLVSRHQQRCTQRRCRSALPRLIQAPRCLRACRRPRRSKPQSVRQQQGPCPRAGRGGGAKRRRRRRRGGRGRRRWQRRGR